ncbi:hypothetical protein DYB37_000885 [Aphanomyces astaci]|uniref:Macro domain-containing protein n=1 Tax=Aphanomyces astaci TaxID=112090 RepID=A0A418DFA7_APHAT|nr:hypothetical protein DYB35_000603 [Aphanomyces astaci]RHZ04895.1 hypothetical protein DYB37_000885 [Aphanomyces astaci]
MATSTRPYRGGDRDWFRVLFGFRELDFDYEEVQGKFELVDNATTLRSIVNGKSYGIGTFECLSLAALRAAGLDTAVGGDTKLRHEASTDVFLDHCDSANQHALFQAASQLNCLEFMSPRSNKYIHKRVVAAGPGTVFRNYFAAVNGKPGQTTENQLNNLDAVEAILSNHEHKYLDVVNGYTDSTPSRLAKLNTTVLHDHATRDVLANAVKIGLHWNVQVPFSSRYATTNNQHFVSQAYCSAISVGYSAASQSDWAPFAKLVLQASYEATLWAGVVNYHRTGCNKVFLTALGGGVFGNRVDWIVDAIAAAVAAVARHGLDIVIVHFRRVDVSFKRDLALALVENRRGQY